jgi:hypothetical protein
VAIASYYPIGPGKLVMDASQQLHLTWIQDGDVYYSHPAPGGEWALPLRLTHTHNVQQHILAVDPAGNLHATWTELNSGAHQIYYASRNGVGWSEPQMAAQSGLSSDFASSVDGSGGMHLAWVSGDPGSVWYLTGPVKRTISGSSSLWQSVTLPEGLVSPVLSFQYHLFGVTPENEGAFTVEVTQGSETTQIFQSGGYTGGWAHQWLDMSAWAGKEVTITFRLTQAENALPAYAYLDDVTLGSAYPDLWVSGGRLNGPPGGIVELTYEFGNQSAIAATASTVTVTLPEKLSFVSADPQPTSINGQTLTWAVGTLASHSGPFTLHVSVQIAQDAPLFSTLAVPIQVNTQSAELETGNNGGQAALYIGRRMFLPAIKK